MKGYRVPVRKKLGEILLNKGKITPEELANLLRIQKEFGKPLGQVLVEHNIVTREELNQMMIFLDVLRALFAGALGEHAHHRKVMMAVDGNSDPVPDSKIFCLLEEFPLPAFQHARLRDLLPFEGQLAAGSCLDDGIQLNVILVRVPADPFRRIGRIDVHQTITDAQDLHDVVREVGKSEIFDRLLKSCAKGLQIVELDDLSHEIANNLIGPRQYRSAPHRARSDTPVVLRSSIVENRTCRNRSRTPPELKRSSLLHTCTRGHLGRSTRFSPLVHHVRDANVVAIL